MNGKNVILTILAVLLLCVIGAEGYVFVKRNKYVANNNNDSTAISSTFDQKDVQAVANLKSLLAKTNGMKFGSSDFEMTKSFYDEKANVVEFRFIQRVFPKTAETPELLKTITASLISTRKKGLQKTTPLIRAMEPLRPTIHDVVTYPDGSNCLSYNIPYNELFFEANNDTGTTVEKTETEKDKWADFLEGQWMCETIDPTMVEVVYNVFTFNNGGYNFTYGSETTYNPSNEYYSYTVSNGIIYSNSGKPLLRISTSPKALISCKNANQIYKKVR